MKKLIPFVFLSLCFIVAAAAAAADEPVPTAAPTVEPQPFAAASSSDEAASEPLPELPEAFDPGFEYTGACCVASCFEEWDQCNQGCGSDPACFQDCRDDLQDCRASC